MYETQHPRDALELDEDTGARTAELLEADVHEMVKRLAAAMDQAINPGRDTRMLVAEALMRLAHGVHLYAAGPDFTRDRLLAMALKTSAHAAVN